MIVVMLPVTSMQNTMSTAYFSPLGALKLDSPAAGDVAEAGEADVAASDGGLSFSTGHSALGGLLAGGAVGAGSGGVAAGAGVGFSLIHPPEGSPNRKPRPMPRTTRFTPLRTPQTHRDRSAARADQQAPGVALEPFGDQP